MDSNTDIAQKDRIGGLGKDGIADAMLTSGGTPAVYIYVTKLIVENPVYEIEILVLTIIFMVPLPNVWGNKGSSV